MTPIVQAIEEDASIAEVARRMIDGHLHRRLVMRGSDAVDIITTRDLLKVPSVRK